ncbi:diguanylate cyclase [Rheinheimera sp.]|uniref:sensor domain-containing diguanylate cyclase n=1 Tax=Rheinheimera sp. TaxID=1869214 RepID=UPI00307D1B17
MNETWLFGPVLNQLNSGVLVVDPAFRLVYLNHFLERHAKLQLQDVKNKSLFEVFTDLPESWLRRKFETVFSLQTPAFSTWEQRQYIVKLPHLRPVTSSSQYMAQNCTMLPLTDPEGGQYVCLLIEDATDAFVYQQHLQQAMAQLEQSNRLDGLTQCLNRRFWEQQLKLEVQRAERYQTPLSLLLFDLDRFKQLNDRYGHQGGDFVLVELAAQVKQLLRDSDWFGRYGGEEFGIVLTNTDKAGAFEVAQRLCQQIAATSFHYQQHKIQVTLSIGVAVLQNFDERAAEQLIAAADQALYQAKRSGRNRVLCFDSGLTSI